jgi:hypothetical protein
MSVGAMAQSVLCLLASSGGLQNHLRIHANERPFACQWPGCDKAFAQKVSWRGGEREPNERGKELSEHIHLRRSSCCYHPVLCAFCAVQPHAAFTHPYRRKAVQGSDLPRTLPSRAASLAGACCAYLANQLAHSLVALKCRSICQCAVCPRSFNRRYGLIVHSRAHGRDVPVMNKQKVRSANRSSSGGGKASSRSQQHRQQVSAGGTSEDDEENESDELAEEEEERLVQSDTAQQRMQQQQQQHSFPNVQPLLPMPLSPMQHSTAAAFNPASPVQRGPSIHSATSSAFAKVSQETTASFGTEETCGICFLMLLLTEGLVLFLCQLSPPLLSSPPSAPFAAAFPLQPMQQSHSMERNFLAPSHSAAANGADTTSPSSEGSNGSASRSQPLNDSAASSAGSAAMHDEPTLCNDSRAPTTQLQMRYAHQHQQPPSPHYRQLG